MRVKFCGITRVEDAREAVRLGAWAIGLNHSELSPRRCDPATALEISSGLRRRRRGRRRVRQPDPAGGRHGRRGRAADHGPAPRRRGPLVLPGGRTADRLQGDQGAAGAEHGRHPGRRGLPHRLPSLRRPPPGNRGRHRRELRLGAARRAALRCADDPRRGAEPRERGRGDRRRAPRRGRRRQRDRDQSGDQGPRADGGVRRGGRGAGSRRRGRRCEASRASRSASAPTAAGSCPKSSLRGSTSSPRHGPPRAWIPGFASGSTRCCATSSAVRRRSTAPIGSSERVGRRVYLKREDLAHTGAHKINNAVGQALLPSGWARRG